MNTEHIERITRRGANTLREALWEFWPGNADNEMPEANLTLHVAHAFMAEGFVGYQEVPFSTGSKEHLDLMLWHPRRRIQVLCEAKRLYNAAQAEKILGDITRMPRFAPDDLSPKRRFGMVVATTWNKDYVHWWSSDEGKAPGGTGSWQGLADDHLLQEAHWGSVVIRSFEEDSLFDADFQHLLYCVFPLEA